jgi:DNA polymerase-4
MEPRDIIHLDMDAFYAAVEVLDNPELKGQPVIVGGRGVRGVVSAASYEARRFGVHSAQPSVTARRLCPDGIFLPVRMERYAEVSGSVFQIFRRYTPLVEPLSIDEAFLDVTRCRRLFGEPPEIARKIKQTVREELGLTVSAGVAPSKLVAKIASDLNKPDGLTVVEHGEVEAFLNPLPIERLWGVGEVTRQALALLGVTTIGHLASLPLDLLEKKFGRRTAEHLFHTSRGEDDRAVEVVREAKSIGHETTFDQDLTARVAVRPRLLALAHEVARRLRQKAASGRTVTLKVKYADFVLITRSVTLPEPTNDQLEIFRQVSELLDKTEVGRRPVRLLGISLSQLVFKDGPGQLALFPAGEETRRRDRLNTALDAIADRFGTKSIRPAGELEE